MVYNKKKAHWGNQLLILSTCKIVNNQTGFHDISLLKYYTIMFGSVKIAWFVALGATPVAATALPAFNVNPDSVSVSGLSSGGFMAAQLGVAYSDIFNVGFGVFAGGPYDCARNQYVCPLALVQNCYSDDDH